MVIMFGECCTNMTLGKNSQGNAVYEVFGTIAKNHLCEQTHSVHGHNLKTMKVFCNKSNIKPFV